MNYKGAWVSNVSYSVGDAVRFTDGFVYHLQKPAKSGTPPVDTLYWGKVDDTLRTVVKFILDAMEIESHNNITLANNLTTTAAGKGLDARQGKALKGLIDGLDEDLAALSPDAKTLVLESSTAESTKKFAITVDDDGELTATEVVPSVDEVVPAGEGT